MKSIVLLILLTLTVLAVQAQEQPTGRAERLPAWLQKKIAAFEEDNPEGKGKVEMYLYKEEKTYLVNFCLGCPDYQITLYNAGGEVMCRFGGIAGQNSCPDFAREARLLDLVWFKD